MTHSYLFTRPRGPIAKAEHRLATRPPRIAIHMVTLVASLILGLVFLSSQTLVPQVIRAPGAILPEGNFVAIETMEGGMVVSVLAQDGDHVRAGDPLVRLQNPNLEREFVTLSEQIAAGQQSLANANAILAAFDTDTPISLDDVHRLRADDLHPAASTLQLFVEKQRIVDGTIQQQQVMVDHLTDALAVAELRIARQREIAEQQSDLTERRIAARSAYIAEIRHLDQLLDSSADTSLRLAEAVNMLGQAKANREQERLTLIQDTLTDRETLRQRLAELQASIAVVTARMDDLVLTAPSDGVIQSTVVSNPGAVIEPGGRLFELVPASQALVVEIRIPSEDIGQVTEGQKVALTIDTFNVRQFGRAQGHVTTVSPVSIVDERTGETYFRGSVELDRAVVGDGAYQRQLQAGMTTVAEISSGEQTLLAAFLGPIHRTFRSAFSDSI